AQGALQEVGQVGARLGVAGVAGGCHRQGEVDRVRHGGVLSFGELHSPLVEGKTPPFTSLPPPGLMRYPRQAARQNSAFLAHWRDRTPASPSPPRASPRAPSPHSASRTKWKSS